MKHTGNPARPAAAFEARAKAALAAENEYRAEAAARIARLEAERIESFRRVRLVKLLADAAGGAETVEAATAAQTIATANEFGWDPAREIHGAVLERLKPAGGAVFAMMRGAADDAAAGQLAAELVTFEQWYQERTGQSFYRLFDVYIPDTPLVDF